MQNMEKENSLLYFFHYILINDILPLEAKYISIRKYKNFTFVREIIQFYLNKILPDYDKTLTINEFNNIYGKELEKILRPYKTEYASLLIKTNEKHLKPYKHVIEEYFQFENGKPSIILSKVDDLVIKLDEILKIQNDLIKKYQLYIPNIDKHINSKVYIKDLELLKEKIKKFHKYYKILEAILNNKGFIEKLNKQKIKHTDKISNLEYLYFVVIHEFWNFLAHFSMGIIYFNSPNNFLSNVNKSIGHLKRAIMDLLDGMIIEYNCSHNLDYLKLRVIKIASLGNRIKIQELIKKLEEIFNNCEEIQRNCS